MPIVTRTTTRRDFWSLNDTFLSLSLSINCTEAMAMPLNNSLCSSVCYANVLALRRRLRKTINSPQVAPSLVYRYNMFRCSAKHPR